jgi:hypothetical protein
LKRLRNAVARRKLQDLHDEKVLQSWLAEVWDQSALVTALISVDYGGTRCSKASENCIIKGPGQVL